MRFLVFIFIVALTTSADTIPPVEEDTLDAGVPFEIPISRITQDEGYIRDIIKERLTRERTIIL